jgi:ABC-type glycerol-3-phosphate transport system substrate-binding protein
MVYTSTMRWRIWLLLAASVILGACAGEEPTPDSQQPTTAIAQPTILPTPTLAVPTPPGTEPPAPRTLAVWVTNEVRADTGAPESAILGAQLAAFQSNHPEVTLQVAVKSATGQGGTLSYLRAGRGLTMDVLPDVVILPADLLSAAWSEHLVFALDDLLPAATQDDLFPVARSLATAEDTLVAFPFGITGLTHVAYSTQVFTGTMPATWDGLLAREAARYAIPGAGAEGAKLALQLYVDLGGTLVGEDGRQHLELEPLTRALTLLSRGREAGLIPIQSSNLATLGEAWQMYQSGSANIAHIDAHEYLAARLTAGRSAVASAPGMDGPLTPLIQALTWAVTTPDPARQALAAELLTWLVEPQNLGEWSLAAHTLPGRRQALDHWPAGDNYTAFVRAEIERAEPYPAAAGSVVMAALTQAVYDVLTATRSPATAAETAVVTVQG